MVTNNGGKDALSAVFSGVGSGVGTYLGQRAANPTPVQAAENDQIIALLQQINQGQKELLAAIKSLSIPGVSGGLWIATEPVLIYEEAIRTIGTFPSSIIVDFRNAKRLLFKIESSLDQAVQVQAVGNIVESFLLADNIGIPVICAIGGVAGIGLGWGDWHPYVAVNITTVIAPTTGRLSIWAVKQE